MERGKRLLLLCVCGYFLSSNISFAQEIKYSLGPVCKNNKVICTNPDEIPICVALSPRIHLKTTTDINGEKINRYQPSCGQYSDNLSPTCIDINEDNETIPDGVILECVEFVKCEIDSKTNKLYASCSNGKMPKCLGNNLNPDCSLETICTNDALPICDYVWEANVTSSSYH